MVYYIRSPVVHIAAAQIKSAYLSTFVDYQAELKPVKPAG
jgi:hypothetical protein